MYNRVCHFCQDESFFDGHEMVQTMTLGEVAVCKTCWQVIQELWIMLDAMKRHGIKRSGDVIGREVGE